MCIGNWKKSCTLSQNFTHFGPKCQKQDPGLYLPYNKCTPKTVIITWFPRLKIGVGGSKIVYLLFSSKKTIPDAKKQDQSFNPPSVNTCYNYSANQIRWHNIATKKVLVALWSPKKKSELASSSHRAALSGNTLLIASYCSFLKKSQCWYKCY